MTLLEARQARDAARVHLQNALVGMPASNRIDAFAAAERALLLAELAGEQSPELEGAELRLRSESSWNDPDGVDAKIIASELDRLRARNRELVENHSETIALAQYWNNADCKKQVRDVLINAAYALAGQKEKP
jgi:hypothetical protein